ncbi:MAG TPA: hypothetical protein VIX35_05810, partial [Vicinamibacterales bacterium]
MIADRRRAFNARFTDAQYGRYRALLEDRCRTPIGFRLSETPAFLPTALIDALVEASQTLVGQLLGNPAYRQAADEAVPPEFRLPAGEAQPTYLQVDFGLVRTTAGLEGRLVELQAFPSLYGFQVAMADAALEAYGLSEVTPFIHGLSREAYLALMRRTIVGDH